jgi:hypothetical protein
MNNEYNVEKNQPFTTRDDDLKEEGEEAKEGIDRRYDNDYSREENYTPIQNVRDRDDRNYQYSNHNNKDFRLNDNYQRNNYHQSYPNERNFNSNMGYRAENNFRDHNRDFRSSNIPRERERERDIDDYNRPLYDNRGGPSMDRQQPYDNRGPMNRGALPMDNRRPYYDDRRGPMDNRDRGGQFDYRYNDNRGGRYNNDSRDGGYNNSNFNNQRGGFKEKFIPNSNINKSIMSSIREDRVDILWNLFDDHVDKMNLINLITIMFQLGKKSKRRGSIRLSANRVRRITNRMEEVYKHADIQSMSIANATYGLLSVEDSHHETTLRLVTIITNMISLCKEQIKAQEVGNAMYGLQNMNSDYIEVRDLVKGLSSLILTCKEPLLPQGVSNATYGLQNLSSEHIEVRELIQSFTILVEFCREPFNAQAVANALFGLKCLDSKYNEVRDLVKGLSNLVKYCVETLKPQEVTNAIYGLQNMNSDYIEIRDLVSSLSGVVSSCKEILTIQEVSNTKIGMRNLSEECEEVAYLNKVISDIIRKE